MKRLLIIDGSSMLSTNYYATLPKSILFAKTLEEKEKHYNEILQNSKGEYTNAMFGMLRNITELKKKMNPEYIAIVFDKSRNTFRRTELGADFYKANRGATPTPLKQQFVAIEKLLEDIGIICLYDDKYEADDFAATLVEKFSNQVTHIYLHTKDHDYFQLVRDNITMWRPSDKKKLEELNSKYHFLDNKELCKYMPNGVFPYTPEVVYDEAGVYPTEITNQLAILGDTGDGIPGCKGVSTAGTLLVNEYKTLENIYELIEECTTPKEEKALATEWKEMLGVSRNPIKALKENKDIVFLSRELATMKRDIDIPYSLDDLKTNINKEKLLEYLNKYEMNSLIKDVENF